MNKIKNNISAHPTFGTMGHDDHLYPVSDGMTLLDYFAGLAMPVYMQ